MYADANAAYLESKVLSASPVELIVILYEAASDAVREARRHLAAREIAERSRSINKACGVLAELISSLDRERGGEVAGRLDQLYGYMYNRLVEANRRQADEPLAEVLNLLATLCEAWEKAGQEAQAPPIEMPKTAYREGDDCGAGSYGPPSPWAQPFPPEPVPAAAYGSHAWSF